MDEIKKLFKIAFVFAGIIMIVGISTMRKEIYFGMFVGSLLAIFGLYITCIEAKASLEKGSPMKSSVLGYAKRYVLYGIFIAVVIKYFGLPTLICSAVGLLTVKFSIYLMTLLNFINSLKKKQR
ncbi:MAG: ATP synthase subunit I [Fusobacteriaceae bacterium]